MKSNLRNLTPEEEAIFNSIVFWHEKNPNSSCIFYEICKGQIYLNDLGLLEKYGITSEKHSKIIEKLAKDGFFEVEPINNVNSSEDTPTIADAYFITLSVKDIKTINDMYIKKHLCTLCFSDKKGCFVIRCDNGNEYAVGKLRYGMPPFEILKFALEEHPGEVVIRDTLNEFKEKDPRHVGKKAILSQVFRNSIVKDELAPFVSLTSDSIYTRPTVKLTLFQINRIKETGFSTSSELV